MNYCIFSIDDRREAYTKAIRDQLSQSFWWDEWPAKCVNGNVPEQLSYAIKHHKYKVAPGLLKGQLGIFYTVLNAMENMGHDDFVTFEDDAILHRDFCRQFWQVTNELPEDTDAFSLFLPRDQDHVWELNREALYISNQRNSLPYVLGVCKAYQRYGGVSMLWTPQGADRFRRLLRRDGITDQWDDQLYKYAKAGEMNVYTQSPNSEILVSISGTENSIVQETEVYA